MSLLVPDKIRNKNPIFTHTRYKKQFLTFLITGHYKIKLSFLNSN